MDKSKVCEIYQLAIDEAVRIIENCRGAGETDLRQVRDRIKMLPTTPIEELLVEEY